MFRYHYGRARGHKRKRLKTQLTYFCNQKHRMHYAEYIRQGLPIGSGVVEAACKTLVTQRMKQSGMMWSQMGGQAILTLRSLIQSDRWKPAWELLRAEFRKTVTVCDAHETFPGVARPDMVSPGQFVFRQPVIVLSHIDHAAISLVA